MLEKMPIITRSFLLPMLVLLSGTASAVTDTFTASGTWTAPAGVTSVTVEAWGGGGAGGGATANPGKGGGGAGGQYAKKVVTVVPGNAYTVAVGAGGVGGTGNGGVGGDSTFAGTVVVAKGGAGGTGVANGVAGVGSAVGGVGDIVYAGGNGANSTVDTNCNTGGGGGGGAGSTGAGGNATGNTGGTGTAVGGGAGGTATTSSGNGAAGTAAGGGGAGACAESNTNRNGGAGAVGKVAVSYVSSGPVAVTYYHDTTNGVNIGFDGTTNVTSGTDQIIPPIITASMITANTCTGNARSQNHPTGLYTHSRWYLTSDYAVATLIGANPTGSARLRGGLITDAVTVSLYDYDPASGAKTLIGSSAPITLTGGGTTTNYPYTISSSAYTVPAGHRLMLQYDFNQLLATERARVYCSTTTPSYITVTESAAATGPHHIEIQHDGNGLTCSADTVTIRACVDAAVPCNTLYTAGGLSVTLTPGGQAFAIDSTGINSAAGVQRSTTGAVTLSAVSVPAATDATPTTCWNTATSTASCAMTFSDSGFVVTAPDHVSCNNASVTIEAVQTAPGTGRCVPAYQNVTRAVNLYTAYASPVTGTMAATASADGGTNWFAVSTASPGAAQNLAFDATGKATLLLNYQDAGQLTLNATGTAPTGKAMTGSGTFVVAPASFVFSGVTAGPIKAGTNFSATVTAMNNCATPAATPNFGKETSPESVTLFFSKCQPTGANAVNGAFVGSVGAFASGVATATNLNWDEVGNGDLVATNSTYLGSSLTVAGNTSISGTVCKDAGGNPIAGKVGSFIPDHFVTTVTDGCAGCGFTYSGQPFTVTVTAMNGLATPAKTFNYDGTANTAPNFANDVSLTDANAAATPVGKFGLSATPMGVTVNGAGDTLTVPKADFVSGVATLNSVPTYSFNAVETVPATIKMRAVDSVNAAVTSSGFTEGGTAIRSGRIKLSNAHGSELLPLPLTATVQYYNSNAWVRSDTDTLTTLNASDFALAFPAGTASKPNNLAACETAVSIAGASPAFTVNLSKPGSGNNGWTNLTLNLGAVAAGNRCTAVGGAGAASTTANRPWLQFPAGANPTARATFGVYKGNNEFIYLRENY